MGRIRTIKPEFPQSETIGSLSRDARLLFIQLWTIVDDAGRSRAAPQMLASLLYPYDGDVSALVDRWLDELQSAGCIRRYIIGGSSYLDIPAWLRHQKIDRPSKSRLPEFVEASANVQRKLDEGSTTDPWSMTMDRDRDRGPWTTDLPSQDRGNAYGSAIPRTRVRAHASDPHDAEDGPF